MSAVGTLIRMIEDEVDKELQFSDCPMDDYGGNYDDAYLAGIQHGRTQLANELNEYLESL